MPSLKLLIYSLVLFCFPRARLDHQQSDKNWLSKPWHSRIPENDFVSSIVTYFNQSISSSLSYLRSRLAYISIDIKFFYHQRSGFWLHQNFTTFFLFTIVFCCLFCYLEILSCGRSIIKSIIIKKGTRERTSKSKHHKTWSSEIANKVDR